LIKGGGLFFVQPSFINGGLDKTKKILTSRGFESFFVKERKKYLSETILTQSLKSTIEKSTGNKFFNDEKGDYFYLQAVLGIKSS